MAFIVGSMCHDGLSIPHLGVRRSLNRWQQTAGGQFSPLWRDQMNEKIRLVEDEAIRMAICDRLESEGYLVESVSDGDKGYRQALRNSYEILLLDVMLAKKSGFDVCRDLRGAGMNILILMLTAAARWWTRS
jgi:response regulator RpfG family c-di-GMP phosphodiesterase